MDMDKDILDDEEGTIKKRSQFLNVLCILTFVGSGLGVLGAIWGLVPSTVETGLQSMRELQETQNQIFDIGDFNEVEYVKWSFYSNIAGIATSLICLTGALLMFRLKRNGYFVYIAGWIAQIVITSMAMPHLLTGDLAGAGVISIVFNILIMIAFFVMYGLNLKHMK
ncbi:MAG: hypothetical protein ACJA0U_000291 [Salibacteraceae bacterium]|jgi:hypothetical protein